jgi:hypothetical protein
MSFNPGISNDLRGLVRDILREVPPQRVQMASGMELVRIASDSDLAAFVARLLEPATAEAIRSGKLRFTLGSTTAAAAPMPAASAILQGVVSEQKIYKLAGTAVLVLAADAVLTPLARDKARRLGLKIERRR